MTSMLDILREQEGQKAAPPSSPVGGNSMLSILQEIENLPAAAPDAAGVPPSPVGALPVDPPVVPDPVVPDPVVPVASGGRNDPRVAPEPPVVADEPFDFDAQIARNNQLKANIESVLAGDPNLRGRNDATRRASAPPIGQDGVNPVSVFNPAPPTGQEIRDAELARIQRVMAQPGPRRDKANLNINPTVSGVSGVPGNYTINVMGSPVPVDDQTAAKAIAEGNTYTIPNNAFLRGLSRANQSMALLGANLGLIDQSEAIAVITELNRITPDQPPELQAALREIVEADGWLESLQAIVKNPRAVLSVIAESLPMSAASLSVFLTGSAVGTPITGASLAGLVTFGQIYNDVILSELREAGVDMQDNQAVQQMLSDPEFYARARQRAGTYAMPIAVFDALSMGLAGKIAGLAIKSGAPTRRIAAAAGGDLLLQMGFGSAGEATAQLLELERGFRDKISKGEIVLEGVAEGPVGAIEVATGTATGARQAQANRDAAEIQAAEEQAAIQAAIALQSSDMAQMAVVPDGQAVSMLDIANEQVSAAAPSTDVAPPTTPEPAAKPTPEPVAAPAVEPERIEPDLMAPVEPEPTPEPAPAAEPAAEPPAPAAEPPAPAAKPDNPQDKPPLTFALKTDQSEKGKRINSVTTPDGETRIAVSVRIVDMADLKPAQGDLQPRDRSLDESAIEIQRRAANLVPGMLMPNNTTDIGAPVIARDGTIISGNGRVASIRQAYEQFPEKAASYRAEVETYLNRADNPNGVGFEMPVLVSMIDQDMTYQELVDLADKSNRSAIATMSATERAQRDAKAMDIEMVNLFKGGSMTSPENMAFRQNFIRSVVAPTEQNQMSRDGRLTKEGVQRMQNAILASAYEDTDALAIMLDSTDDNIKAISNAMLDAAPSFAKLKSDIAAGEVPSQFDISSKVTEAARTISDLRNRGIKPRDFFAQQDAFSQTDPLVEALIRAFYNEELTRAKSQRIMSDVLKFYTEEAAQKRAGGFFEDATTPRDVIELARRKADGTEGQAGLFPADGPVGSTETSGQQAPIDSTERSSEDTGQAVSRETETTEEYINSRLMRGAELREFKQNYVPGTPRTKRVVLSLLLEAVEKAEGMTFKIHDDPVRFSEPLEGVEITFTAAMEKVYGPFNPQQSDVEASGVAAKHFWTIDTKENQNGDTKIVRFDARPSSSLISYQGGGTTSELRNIEREHKGLAQVEKAIERINGKDFKQGYGGAKKQTELKDEATGTIRAEVASEETVGAAENTVLPISELDSQRTQKPGTLVDKEAMRKGSALQLQAFADAGLDPNRAINMPIERQFKVLSDMFVEKFGFKSVVKVENTNSKEAVDQLLVGYHNLTNLAANLGLPEKAFGLEGTLSFVLAKNIGAYGVYYPGAKTIAMPRRSNSFAHEWFHALDHYLLEKYGSGEKTSLPLASEAVRKHGTEAFGPDAPTTVQDSYFALMRALFKDKASEAAQLQSIDRQMAEIEARAAKAGKPLSENQAYQKLQKQKQNILGSIGKSQKIGKTQMRKDAEFFAQISQSGVKYWTMPAEMAARAFEAFAITQVTNAGLQTGFLGKSRQAYEMTLEQLGVSRDQLANPRKMADVLKIMDSRLALTFPKDQERVEIFGAYRNLMDAIARETALGEGKAATEVGNDFVLDVRKMHDVPENVSQGIIADQKREMRNAKNFADKQKGRPKTYGERYGRIAMPFYYIEDSFFAPFFYQKQGQLKAIMKRYPSNRSMRIIYQSLATQTAGEFQTTQEGGNLLDAQARQIRVFSDRLKNVLNQHDVAGFNELETQQLHMILTSQDDLGSAPDNVVKAAGGFRAIYNMMYDYARSAELDIGYAPSGYVPRVLDHTQVAADGKKFKRQAAKVYRIVYDDALGPLESDNLDYMLKTIQFIREQRLSIEQLNEETNRRRSLATEPEYLSFTQGEKWKRVRTAKSQLDALQKAKKQDPAAVEQSAIDAAQEELDDAVAAAASDFEQFHGAMRNLFAKFSAFNWHMKVQQSHVGDPTDGSPQAKFSKKRQLPPEADALMEQFYVSDPVEAITNYILSVVRKAEYNRRFGAHKLPAIASKNDYADYLDYLVKKLEDDMSLVEANEVKTTVDNILGRNMEGFMPGMAQKAANRAAAVLSITLLVRAPIASIAEPMTVAMTTGSVTKGLRSFGSTLMEFPGLRKLSKNATEDIRLRHQFARILGIIDDPEVGDIMTSRIGGEFAGDPNINRMQSKFFAKIKLSGITNAQRRSASKIGFQYIVEMAHEIRNPSSDRNKARAELVLKDLGVHQSRLDQFVDFVLDYSETKAGLFGRRKVKVSSLPEPEAVMDDSGDFTDMGLQLSVSVMRFVDQTIQDPRTTDRPRWAETGIGRIIYGITSFIYSFQDKVLKAMGRKFKREYGISRNQLGRGRARATGDAASWAFLNAGIPLMSLFSAHAIVSTAREYIFNQDRWDREWEESEKDPSKFALNYLLPLAFTRAGLTGAFDPIVQAFTGLKYQRDIANSFLGIGSYVAQNLGDIFQVFSSNNSPNTVSSEFKALRGLYNLIVQPAVSLALASMPLTPATAIPATGAAMSVTSASFKNELINQILELFTGQRYQPGQRGRPPVKRIGDK